MTKRRYQGKTLAYKRFHLTMWRTERFLELGLSAIEETAVKEINSAIAEFKGIKGISGPFPKKYKLKVKPVEKNGDGVIHFLVDKRTAFLFKKVLEEFKKRQGELKFFLFSNMIVSTWGALETYSQMLFEQLFLKKPQMLKSKESIGIQEVVSNKDNIIEYLAENQLKAIGHFNIEELLDYYAKKINFTLSSAESKKIKDYYIIRNIIAHKSGIIRKSQAINLPPEVKIVRDEIRISKRYLKRMIKFTEQIVEKIEKVVESKFYNKT